MTTTRLAVMERMADALGLRRTGQITSSCASTATSLIDTTNRYEADDYWNEGYLLTTGSTNAGIERRLSDYSVGTQTLTLYSAVGTALSSSTTYDLFHPPVEPYEYRTAIKAAASQLAARGITRRALDTTLVTTAGRKYALPSTIDVELTEVWLQAKEFIANNIWIDGTSGWTLHASASLTNDGANGERTLKLVATAADEHSYCDVDVSPMQELEFFAKVKSDGTRAARWQYRIVDTTGAVIVAYTTIGSAVTLAAWTQQTGTIRVPANGTRVRIAFNADAAGTVYTEGPQLMRYGEWERIGNWRLEYSGETGYFVLPYQPGWGRRLKLVGRQTLESLSADSDTISMDEPEIEAFVELACAEAWRQFGPRLGLDQGVVRDETDRHDKQYKKLIGGLSGPWRRVRHANTPTFSAGH